TLTNFPPMNVSSEQIDSMSAQQLRRAEGQVQFLKAEVDRLKKEREQLEEPSFASMGGANEPLSWELTLRESEERYRQLANAIPQVVYIAGPDGRTQLINEFWEGYSGASTQA